MECGCRTQNVSNLPRTNLEMQTTPNEEVFYRYGTSSPVCSHANGSHQGRHTALEERIITQPQEVRSLSSTEIKAKLF